MIRPENRFTLFGIMRQRTILAQAAAGQRLLKTCGQA
jgi:hypothetical protein